MTKPIIKTLETDRGIVVFGQVKGIDKRAQAHDAKWSKTLKAWCFRLDQREIVDKLIKTADRPPRSREVKNPAPVLEIGTLGTYTIGTEKFGKKVVTIQDKGRTIGICGCDNDGTPLNMLGDQVEDVLTWRCTKQWVVKGTALKKEPGVYEFNGVATNYMDTSKSDAVDASAVDTKSDDITEDDIIIDDVML